MNDNKGSIFNGIGFQPVGFKSTEKTHFINPLKIYLGYNTTVWVSIFTDKCP
jgi:hypothetical protein